MSPSASVLESEFASENNLVLKSSSQYEPESVAKDELDRRDKCKFRVRATFSIAVEVVDVLVVVRFVEDRFVEDGIAAGNE
jgi:hypothetical protein